MKTSFKTAVLVLMALSFCLVVFWWIHPRAKPAASAALEAEREIHFNHWLQFMMFRQHVPQWADSWFNLAQRQNYFETLHEKSVAKLVASGSYTNLTIEITNFPPTVDTDTARMNEVRRRWIVASLTNTFTSYWFCENSINLTCPTSDLPRLRAAMQTP